MITKMQVKKQKTKNEETDFFNTIDTTITKKEDKKSEMSEKQENELLDFINYDDGLTNSFDGTYDEDLSSTTNDDKLNADYDKAAEYYFSQQESKQKDEQTDKIKNEIQTVKIFRNIIDGSMFSSEDFVQKVLPLIVFCTVLILLVIANRNQAESLIRKNYLLQKQVKELRAESIIIAAKLMNISKETEVIARIQDQNLKIKQQKEPPMYFVVQKYNIPDSLMDYYKPKSKYDKDFTTFELASKKY